MKIRAIFTKGERTVYAYTFDIEDRTERVRFAIEVRRAYERGETITTFKA